MIHVNRARQYVLVTVIAIVVGCAPEIDLEAASTEASSTGTGSPGPVVVCDDGDETGQQAADIGGTPWSGSDSPRFRIQGDISQRIGLDAANVGDVNGDGYDDLGIVARGPALAGKYPLLDTVQAFVFLGYQDDDDFAEISLGALLQGGTPGEHGFHIYTSYESNLHHARFIGPAGDFNGDGADDVVLVTWYNGGHVAHFVHGGTSLEGGTVAPGFTVTFTSELNLHTMRSALPLGDVNGDGVGDVAFAFLPIMREDLPAKVVTIFGGQEEEAISVDLEAVEAEVGMVTLFDRGWAARERMDIASAGDVDGNGILDAMLISYDTFDTPFRHTVVFVWLRDNMPAVAPISIVDAEDDAGFAITLPSLTGTEEFQQTGGPLVRAVSIGDINGDQRTDLAFGAPQADGCDGFAYLVYGDSYPYNINVAEHLESGVHGYVFSNSGPGDRFFANAISGIGDIDGDGNGDFAISRNLHSGVPEGRVYVIHGASEYDETDVYVLQNGGPEAWFFESGNDVYDRFGAFLVSGNFDGEGAMDIAVGTPEVNTVDDLNGQIDIIRM